MDRDHIRKVFTSYSLPPEQAEVVADAEQPSLLLPLADLRFAITAALGVRLKAREIRSYVLRAPGEFRDGMTLEQFLWIVDSIAASDGGVSEVTYYQVLDPRHRGMVSAEDFQAVFTSVAPKMSRRCGADIFSTLDESGCGKLSRPRLFAILKENL